METGKQAALQQLGVGSARRQKKAEERRKQNERDKGSALNLDVL